MLARFLNQIGAAEVDQHAFGARRDETSSGTNKNMAGTHGRDWILSDFELTVSEVLNYLLHFLSIVRNFECS